MSAPDSLSVQRIATGLLAALDLKEGRTPSFLSNEYVATFDVFELCLQDTFRSNASVVTPVNGYAAAAGLAVPSGEIWLVTNFAARITCGAGVTVASCTAAYERIQNVTNAFPGSGISAACPASTTVLVGGPVGTRPIILRQGDNVGVFCHGVVGAPTGDSRIDYYRLRV